MRRAALLYALPFAAIVAASCSGDGASLPSDPGTAFTWNRPATPCRAITDDFMDDWWQTLRPVVKLRLIHIHLLMRQGKVAQARTEMFQLWDLVLKAYYAGKIRGGMSAATQTAVLQFGQLIYCMVGLDGSGLTLGDPLGSGNVTQVVFPSTSDQDVVHGSGNAGVRFFANTLGQPATVTLSGIAPPTVQFSGPLNTKLDQYGPVFVEIHVVPAQTFSQLVLVEECLAAPVGDLPATVHLAHNVGSGIEIFAKEDQHLLNCTGLTQAAPSARQLFASGDLRGALHRIGERALSLVTPSEAWAGGTGVSGKTKNFSPFGGVDTLVVMDATAPLYQSAPTGSDVPVAPSVIVHTTGAHTPLPGANVMFTVTWGAGSITAIGNPAHVTSVPTTTGTPGTAAVGSWTLGAGYDTVTAVGSFPAPPTGVGVGILSGTVKFGAIGGDVVPWEAEGYRYLVGPANHDPGFEATSFSDGGWSEGRGGFSDHVAPTAPYCPIDASAHTAWNSDPAPTDMLLRRTFTLPPGWTSDLTVSVAIDNDIEVSVNGTAVSGVGFVTHEGCATRGSFTFNVPHGLLVAGSNLIAVRARDRGAAAFVDIQVTVAAPIP